MTEGKHNKDLGLLGLFVAGDPGAEASGDSRLFATQGKLVTGAYPIPANLHRYQNKGLTEFDSFESWENKAPRMISQAERVTRWREKKS